MIDPRVLRIYRSNNIWHASFTGATDASLFFYE